MSFSQLGLVSLADKACQSKPNVPSVKDSIHSLTIINNIVFYYHLSH